MNYYIGDLHLFNRNQTDEGRNYDRRPFATVEEMNQYILERWNAKINNGDTVYILGDMAMDELLNKISNQFLFQIEEPESASVVIGTARAGHFSWRVENGFRDIFSVEQWLRDNPEFSIYDEYGTAITWEQFKEAVAWCNG